MFTSSINSSFKTSAWDDLEPVFKCLEFFVSFPSVVSLASRVVNRAKKRCTGTERHGTGKCTGWHGGLALDKIRVFSAECPQNMRFLGQNRAADVARARESTARGLGTEQGTGTVDHPVGSGSFELEVTQVLEILRFVQIKD